jgi:hypothetical protein
MMTVMKTKSVTVRSGRVVVEGLDKYPDGTELQVRVVDDDDDEFAYLDNADELDDEDRAALEECLLQGIAEAQAGLGRPAAEVLADLKRLR